MSKNNRYILAVLLIVLLISCISSAAYGDEIKRGVSLGDDLTDEQIESMLRLFKVNEDEAYILEVTNEEERDYLKGLVSDKVIGSRAISSAYVETLDNGGGIHVKTHNIDWVTKEMYANALATAGIENARIIAAAPFKVSGTAALTGIMKAFERASGKDLSEESKRIANEELVTTGNLGDDIGKDKAAALVNRIKECIIRSDIKDPVEIRKTIIDIAAELDIKLTDEHIDKLASLMEKISKLDLDADRITSQLDNIGKSLDKLADTLKENRGILQRILDAIKSFFKWIAGLLK